jgi:MarR family transcriptional regulator, transcriptional regulator for hemolysin
MDDMQTSFPPLMSASAPTAPQRLGGLIGRTGRQWRRVVDLRMQPFDLTEATWLPLIHLARAVEPMRQKDLAIALALDKSSVVRIVKGLEDAGLITRGEDQGDHRAKPILITASGRKLADRVEGVSQELEHELLAEIAPDDLATTRGVLERLSAHLERFGGREAKP